MLPLLTAILMLMLGGLFAPGRPEGPRSGVRSEAEHRAPASPEGGRRPEGPGRPETSRVDGQRLRFRDGTTMAHPASTGGTTNAGVSATFGFDRWGPSSVTASNGVALVTDRTTPLWPSAVRLAAGGVLRHRLYEWDDNGMLTARESPGKMRVT